MLKINPTESFPYPRKYRDGDRTRHAHALRTSLPQRSAAAPALYLVPKRPLRPEALPEGALVLHGERRDSLRARAVEYLFGLTALAAAGAFWWAAQ